MQFELSTFICESVAGLSLAAAVAAAIQNFQLRKRVAALESAQISIGDEDLTVDTNGLAARISSMGESIAILQSSVAALNETVANSGARSENATATAEPVFDGKPIGRESAGRRTAASKFRKADTGIVSFQTELDPVAPINLNRRGQMMRMHRRGESVAAIASALGVSQGEVKLTVRMQEVYSDSSGKEISQNRL